MLVMKFGGTSMGSPQRIKDVAAIVTAQNSRFHSGSDASASVNCIVVVSAMAGTTNTLLQISQLLKQHRHTQALEEISKLEQLYHKHCEHLFHDKDSRERVNRRMQDLFSILRQYSDEEYITDFEEKTIVSIGERLSTKMLTEVLLNNKESVAEWNALDFMRIDNRKEVDFQYLRTTLTEKVSEPRQPSVIITQGFICRNAYGEIDNLQRGGSDHTATLIAAALNAAQCQIWTDVSGVQTADPRHIKRTQTIPHLHFDEAIALAYNGAKVLHPVCVEPAKQHNVPILLLNTMEPGHPGTTIDNRHDDKQLKAIASCQHIIHLQIVCDNTGQATLQRQVWNTITQYIKSIHHLANSHNHISLCLNQGKALQQIIQTLDNHNIHYTRHEATLITIVGDGMTNNIQQVSEKILHAVRNISVPYTQALKMINSGVTDNSISLIVSPAETDAIIQQLNDTLFA